MEKAFASAMNGAKLKQDGHGNAYITLMTNG